MSGFDKKRLQKIQGQEKTGKKHTIMIVDDEECHLYSMSSMFAEYYNIITAQDGQEALDYIQKMENPEIIRLIISDQRMPRLTGIELFENLEEIIPNVIRIILTGYDKDVSDEEAKKNQIYKIISKPFAPDELIKQVIIAIKDFENQEKKN